MKYKELWHDHNKSWIKYCDYPQNQENEMVVVKAINSLVSQGTERLVTSGKMSENVYQKIKIPHMKGSFSDQFTYGYSLVGEVVAGPNNIIGNYVHLLHPHQEIAFINSGEISIIPDGMSPAIATLASNMETAVNAVWDARVELGDNVLIIGYGLIGALVASLLIQIPEVELTVLELNHNRSEKAIDMGISVVTSKEHLECAFDIAFNTSASSSGLQLAIDKTIAEGRIVELSWYGSKRVTLDFGNDFHFGRKKIISSQVSNIPALKQHNWSIKKRKELVFRLLNRSDLSELVENEISFGETPHYYEKLRSGKINEISTIISYGV